MYSDLNPSGSDKKTQVDTTRYLVKSSRLSVPSRIYLVLPCIRWNLSISFIILFYYFIIRLLLIFYIFSSPLVLFPWLHLSGAIPREDFPVLLAIMRPYYIPGTIPGSICTILQKNKRIHGLWIIHFPVHINSPKIKIVSRFMRHIRPSTGQAFVNTSTITGPMSGNAGRGSRSQSV